MSYTDLVDNVRFKVTRRVTGAAGAPATMLAGEIAHNMVTNVIYFGRDDGFGVVTPEALDLEALQALIAAGSTELTAGTGITITDGVITVNTTVIATKAYVDSQLSLKVDSAYVTAYVASAIAAAKVVSDAYADDAAATAAAGALADANTYTDTALSTVTFDTSRITTGLLDPARIPVLNANKTIISSGAITDLTTPQKADIETGTVIVTTDGNRWVYSGVGDKALEASYIVLADVTPEWSVIANKPTFADVALSGDYDDLINLPTLGSMAAQNSDNVAITGGTVTGIILDGGTY